MTLGAAVRQFVRDNSDWLGPLFGFLIFVAVENIRRRPPPAPDAPRWKWWLWERREWLMVMPWDRWGGYWKAPFKVEPTIQSLRDLGDPRAPRVPPARDTEITPVEVPRPSRPTPHSTPRNLGTGYGSPDHELSAPERDTLAPPLPPADPPSPPERKA